MGDAAVVMLEQVIFFANMPNTLYGGYFETPHCYGGYFHNTSTKSCDQCQEGSFKDDDADLQYRTATTCTSCPQGRYGDAAAFAMTSLLHCKNAQQANLEKTRPQQSAPLVE